MKISKILNFMIGFVVTTTIYLPFLGDILNKTSGVSQIQQAGEIPEPTSIILVALGGVLIHRKHQRHTK